MRDSDGKVLFECPKCKCQWWLDLPVLVQHRCPSGKCTYESLVAVKK